MVMIATFGVVGNVTFSYLKSAPWISQKTKEEEAQYLE
jgi:hypothetical protein